MMRIDMDITPLDHRHGDEEHERALWCSLIPRHRKKRPSVLPLTTALAVNWSCEALSGYRTGRANATGTQLAEVFARGLREAS